MLHNRMVWLGLATTVGLTGCSLFGVPAVKFQDRPDLFAYESLTDNTVSVVSVVDKKYAASISVGNNPVNLALNPRADLEYLYTANQNDGTVSFVNLRSAQQQQAIQVGQSPWGIGITPYNGTNQWLVVANSGDNTISRIDPVSRAVQTKSIPGLMQAHGVVTVPYNSAVAQNKQVLDSYILSDVPTTGNGAGCQITKINADGSTGATIVLPTSQKLWKGAITPDGSELYITDLNSPNLWKVKLSTMTFDNSITLDAAGYDVSISADGKTAYVSIPVGPTSTNAQGLVDVIDLASGAKIKNPVVNDYIKEANRPEAIAVNSTGTELWVALQNRLGYFINLDPTSHAPSAQLAVAPYTLTPGQAPAINDLKLGAGIQQ